MKSLVLHEKKRPLKLEDRPPLEPGPGQAIVNLRAAALNRRDYWITQGMYPGIRLPVVLGSDGAGVVTAVADDVESNWLDAEVIMNPGLEWGSQSRVQGESFQILGMPSDGTFAEQVAVEAQYLHRRPSHLNWQQAAAVPLAGVTAYRAAIVQGQLQPDQKVLITGIGGGVATFALQFAVQLGCHVAVTSSSKTKLDRAQQLGATVGFNYQQDDWDQQLLEEFGAVDLIIDSAAGQGYAALIKIARPGGRIVNYGATTGAPPTLDMFQVFWKQLTLQGTTMGSPDDFRNMLDFVSQHQIQPAIDQTFALSEGNAALQRLRDGEQFGKVVLDV